jgi:hypothetical protein
MEKYKIIFLILVFGMLVQNYADIEDNYLYLEGTDNNNNTIVEKYTNYNVSNGDYSVSWDGQLTSAENLDSNGVALIYLNIEDTDGNEYDGVGFKYLDGWDGTKVYIVDGKNSYPLDINPFESHTYSIKVSDEGIEFYVDGDLTKNLNTSDLGYTPSIILHTGAGSWDSNANYTMKIDNIIESENGTIVSEDFEDGNNDFFDEYTGGGIIGIKTIFPTKKAPIPLGGVVLTLIAIPLLTLKMVRK